MKDIIFLLPVWSKALKYVETSVQSLVYSGLNCEIMLAGTGPPPFPLMYKNVAKRYKASYFETTDLKVFNQYALTNTGFKNSDESKMVCAFDADLVITPLVAEKMKSYVGGRALYQFSHMRLTKEQSKFMFDGEKFWLEYTATLQKIMDTEKISTLSNTPPHLIPRDFFAEVHGYNEQLIWWNHGDYDFMAVARSRGLPIEKEVQKSRAYVPHLQHSGDRVKVENNAWKIITPRVEESKKANPKQLYGNEGNWGEAEGKLVIKNGIPV